MNEHVKPEQTTYAAFISYRHIEPDMSVAKALHTMLETYRIPKLIGGENGSKRLGKIFRDRDELPVSEDLSRDILGALQSSRFMIVICSPGTPQSKWCTKEIEIFKNLHGNTSILPLLIAGEPDISFPPALRTSGATLADKDSADNPVELEPLAADIRAQDLRSMIRLLKRHEILRLLAPMLGVSYDSLRQRERARIKQRRTRIAVVSVASAITLGLLISLGLSRIEIERQRAELATERAQTQQERAETLQKSTELSDLLVDAQNTLKAGWRLGAMRMVCEILDRYSPKWPGYSMIRRSAELVLQRAAIAPVYSSIGTITTSANPSNRNFNKYISKDGKTLFACEQQATSISRWDIETGRLLSSYAVTPDAIITNMYIDEDQGHVVGTLYDPVKRQFAGITGWDLDTSRELFTVYPDDKILSQLGENSFLQTIVPSEPGKYVFVYKMYGPVTTPQFALTVSTMDHSLTISPIIPGPSNIQYADPNSLNPIPGVSSRLTGSFADAPGGTNVTVHNPDRTTLRTYYIDVYNPSNAWITKDERYLIAIFTDGSGSANIYIFDLNSKSIAPLAQYEIDGEGANGVAFIPEQNLLILQGEYNIYFCHILSGDLKTLHFSGEVDHAILSADGTILAFGIENQIQLISCKPQGLFAAQYKVEDTIANAQYCVETLNLQGVRTIEAKGIGARLIGDNTIEIFETTNQTVLSSFISAAPVSTFTLDPGKGRVYIYSYELGNIITWDWRQNKILHELTTLLPQGAAALQPSKEKDLLYVINGFALSKLDLASHRVLRSMKLDEENRASMLVDTYIVDEENDRVYAFCGDEQRFSNLETFYSIFQLSTGEKICSDNLPNRPLASARLRYHFFEKAGIAITEQGSNKVLANVYVPTLNDLVVDASR